MTNLRFRIDRFASRFEHDFVTLNRIEVSRSALLGNARIIKSQHPGQAVIPVLKANAYGHGLELVAHALNSGGFPYLAVDGYFEALRVRSVTKQPVLVMGYIHPDNYGKLRLTGLAFVVHDLISVQALAATGRKVKIHIEVNTGMNRHGVQPADLPELLAEIKRHRKLEVEGLMSHLADADGEKDTFTQSQVKIFEEAVETVRGAGFLPKWVHLSQTAGSTKVASKTCNAIRLGIGLYGVNPLSEKDAKYQKLQKLQPALRLVSTIAKVIYVKKGDKVSYNGIWTAPRSGRIGVLPLGYYEGVSRGLSNSGQVLWNGKYLPIVGRVCMNHTMVDLSGTSANQFDEVTVISNHTGDKNSVNGLARENGLFTYSTLTSLSPDVRRVLVD